MAITHVTVRGLDIQTNKFEIIKEWDVQYGETDPERRGHEIAAEWLNRNYPELWCYAYGKVDPRIVLPKHADPSRVASIGMIVDGGFTGQFQWNDRAWNEHRLGIGGYVPAVVDLTDPVKEAAYQKEQEERRAANAAKAARVYGMIGMPKSYIEFGYGKELDQRVTWDGMLMATLYSYEQIVNGDADHSAKFYELGGSDEHSGYSWGCVKNVAAILTKHGWKSVDEIPPDSPLYERVRQ